MASNPTAPMRSAVLTQHAAIWCVWLVPSRVFAPIPPSSSIVSGLERSLPLGAGGGLASVNPAPREAARSAASSGAYRSAFFAGLPPNTERQCHRPATELCRRGAARPPRLGSSVSTRPRSSRGSDRRTEIMPRLSDTQAVLLTAAAARPDLNLLPVPDIVRLKGAALDRTLRFSALARLHCREVRRRRSYAAVEVGHRSPHHHPGGSRGNRHRGPGSRGGSGCGRADLGAAARRGRTSRTPRRQNGRPARCRRQAKGRDA